MELKIPASTATSSLLLACCIIGTLESRLARGTDPVPSGCAHAAAALEASPLRQEAHAVAAHALGWPGERAFAAGPDRVLGTSDDRGIPPFGVTFDGDAVPRQPAGLRSACAQDDCALAFTSVHSAFRGSAAPGHFWSGAAISR